jgi:cell division protein FtsB
MPPRTRRGAEVGWRMRDRVLLHDLFERTRILVPPRLLRRYRESPGFRRRVHHAARWSWVVVLAWAFVFGDNGAAAIVWRWARIQKLQREVAVLERRDGWLRNQIELREKDPATLERLARERCGMAFRGEKVYRIVEVTPGEARRLEREKRSLTAAAESNAETAPVGAPDKQSSVGREARLSGRRVDRNARPGLTGPDTP